MNAFRFPSSGVLAWPLALTGNFLLLVRLFGLFVRTGLGLNFALLALALVIRRCRFLIRAFIFIIRAISLETVGFGSA